MTSQMSEYTAAGDETDSNRTQITLDLSELPTLYVLPVHMAMAELHGLEDQLRDAGAPLTYDPHEARLFLGKITQKRRVLMELRSRGVWSTEVASETVLHADHEDHERGPVKKKRRDDRGRTGQNGRSDDSGSTTDDESDAKAVKGRRGFESSKTSSPVPETVRERPQQVSVDEDVVCVLKLEWFYDSMKQNTILPLDEYIIYTGRRASKELISPNTSNSNVQELSSTQAVSVPAKTTDPHAILERAKADAPAQHSEPRSFASTSQFSKRAHPFSSSSSSSNHRIARLVHQTTSEHDLGNSDDLPEMPDWVKQHRAFACERSTPLHGPNDAFAEQLKKIRLARTLLGDDIGVRAYSTSIASIAAYPYTLTDQREILALPGCDAKIAALWVEWMNKSGTIQAVQDAENDEMMKVLRLFYEIWGVGAHTARDFYNRGWRDLDDVVEYGWSELSRVQQIGVKFYDEFQQKISRDEVELIGRIVHEHAQKVRDPSGVRSCIVGGYRRGKKESGDVDIIVSHLDEGATLGIIEDIVKSLYDTGWVTHELITHTSGSRRGQATLPFRAGGGGHGFDTLDKALVVWQDPEWHGRGIDDSKKNPNVHRRVDIIIAPWSRVGCAVLGWTAGMTFERDLRRYARKVKGWKFDSSGVRDRNTGVEVDLEAIGGRCETVEEAERKVFKGFGLRWIPPEERNTF